MISTDRGDVVELLDSSGQPFAAYRYDAWGNPLGEGNAGEGAWVQGTTALTETLAAEIASRQVLRYAGYCYDSESGMYCLSARHYDPETRQFLSKDLSRNDGEQSAYGYCLGNPVGSADPSGLAAVAYAPGARKERNPLHVNDMRVADWRNPANRVDTDLRVTVVESADIDDHPGGFLGYKVGDVVVTYRCKDDSRSGSKAIAIAYVVITVDSYSADSENPDLLELWSGMFTEVVQTADIAYFEAQPLRPPFTQYVFHADLLRNPGQKWSSWSPLGVAYDVHVHAYDRNGDFVEHTCATTGVRWPLCDSQGLLLEIMSYVDVRADLFGPR
jgi:RHS repeat-associated protein